MPGERLRVLAVCAVNDPGGAEVGLLRLLDRRPDWAITLTTPGHGPLRDAARDRGWATASLPVGGLAARAGVRALASMPAARRLAGAHDVAYANGTVAARLLPALCAAPRTVLHVHDMVTRVPRHWRRADVVLADSQAVASRLPRLDSNVVYCPVALDPPVLDRPPWTVDPRRPGPVIGFVGRLEKRKGADVFVAAAPIIRATWPTGRMFVVGDDPFDSNPGYSRTVSRAPEVEHISWVDNAPGLMRHLDVLVVPSRQEPFGTVAAEAMAVGTAVVASRVDGLPEVIEDGVSGILVEPENPAALAHGVLAALRDAPALGAAGRVAARRFDADHYAAHVGALVAG